MIIRKINGIVEKVIAPKYKKVYQFFYFKSLRKRLVNTDFSLISPNCYAGIIYHRLGLRFTSPTINLLFPIKKQYLKFVSNLEYYLKLDLQFIKDEKYRCPVAMLDDVKIVFNHYKTETESSELWNKRKQRINYRNLFIIFDDCADAEYKDLLAFENLDCKGKVILSPRKYNGLNHIIQISKYKEMTKMPAYLLDESMWTGKNVADSDFDFVSWLNGTLKY